MSKTTEIKFVVSLDENNIPEIIKWESSDKTQQNNSPLKAILISMFEDDTKDTLKLDLWTKEMQIAEMDRFLYHTLRSLCDTYSKATNNHSLANDMRKFVEYFGEKVEIIKASSDQ